MNSQKLSYFTYAGFTEGDLVRVKEEAIEHRGATGRIIGFERVLARVMLVHICLEGAPTSTTCLYLTEIEHIAPPPPFSFNVTNPRGEFWTGSTWEYDPVETHSFATVEEAMEFISQEYTTWAEDRPFGVFSILCVPD